MVRKRIARVKFDVEVPDDMPYQAVEDWLRFSFGDNGSMKVVHPAMETEPEPIFGTFDVELR